MACEHARIRYLRKMGAQELPTNLTTIEGWEAYIKDRKEIIEPKCLDCGQPMPYPVRETKEGGI
jgi:hypothetical protein